MALRMFFIHGLILVLCLVDNGSTKELANDESKMGMEVLFDMVHVFLGDIVQTKNISESFLNLSTIFVNDDFDRDQLTDWKEWADYGKGYAAGTAVGLLFIVLMPIVGLIFCCCRVCGKCGGKRRLHDTRRSKCQRRTYCTLVLIFNTLALAGVICAFMCSNLIHKALKNENDEGTIGHIRSSLTSIKNFTDDAVTNVSNTVSNDFEVIASNAISNINETAFRAVDNVLTSLNATRHIDKAYEISQDVNKTKVQLEEVGRLVGDLSQDSEDLKNSLLSIKNNIQAVCDDGADCVGFNPADYTTDAEFSSLSDLQEESMKVAATMDMAKYIKEAEAQIEKAKEETKKDIDNTIKNAKLSINDIRVTVHKGLDDLKKQKDDAMSFYPSVEQDLKDADDDMKDSYSNYVYYGCIGVSCVYLFIVILYYMGIVFGLCGERPGHDAPCCNRGVGAKFLMAGVGFTFLFSWILMLLCTILFILGGISYTEVCQYFQGHDPSSFKIFDDTLNRGLDLSKTLYNNSSVKFSLSRSIRDCQENKAIYSAFKIDHIVSLDKTIDIQPLKDELNKLQTSSLNIPSVTILNNDLKTKLEGFASSGINNIDFNSYFIQLNNNLTKVEVSQLYTIITQLANRQANTAHKNQLLVEADRLKYLNDKSIPVLKQDMEDLKPIVKKLQEGSNITNSIDSLITGLTTSEKIFNTNKESLVQKEINVVADLILKQTNTTVDALKSNIRTDIGRCQALSDSIYSVSDSVCVLLIDPLNGMWFSFGWCLFFFILCLIFGVLLAGEYRHECKYGKDFDDPFDGRNHDMLPLTRRMDC